MSTTWQTVRVFISSTFRDMHAERDHLVTVVFPELRERIEQLGLEFFDVDLRWGVPAKDANGETANSWEYCRQWIDRVEPFFVCILGQRYGWVPEPEQLKAREDSQRQQVEKRSITDMEVRHAVLDTKLKRRSYFYLRATDAPATASEYVDPPPLLRKLEQLKNEVRSCGRPVWDYPCEWTGSGFAGMEELGRCVLDDLWSGVLRDERYVSKDVWRQAIGADPDSDARYTDESKPVPPALTEKLVALARPAPVSPLDAERQQMDAFATSRLRWFQGRTRELQQLTDFLHAAAADAPRLAIVAAVPGQGKSALLARLWRDLTGSDQSAVCNPQSAFVITHFVGATERSASAHALVERLLGELDGSGMTWPAEQQEEGQEPRRDFNSLCLRLAQWLGDYAGERRIVILLDALNQLSDEHDLQWLPTRLGPSVRVIVSCVEDAAAKPDSREQRVLHALASRQPASLRVPLEPLTEEDVRTIVVAYLNEYCHELDREHLDTLCAITQARNPLYLLVMLNGSSAGSLRRSTAEKCFSSGNSFLRSFILSLDRVCPKAPEPSLDPSRSSPSGTDRLSPLRDRDVEGQRHAHCSRPGRRFRSSAPRPSARHLETSGRPNGGVGRPSPNETNSQRKQSGSESGQDLMLRFLNFAPKGQRHASPGHRPGNWIGC